METIADPSPVLRRLGAATLGESGGRPMHPRIAPAWRGATVAAPAYTVRCTPGDNLAVHAAVVRAPKGSVLVVDVGELAERGYWGEVLTTAAQSRGLAGLVIDGGVRDVAALEQRAFPVFAVVVALRGAGKTQPGQTGAPVKVGGAEVAAGDWVVGDADGVTVVPEGQLAAVVEAGEAREAKEARMFEALEAGATTVELLGLDVNPIGE